MFFYPSLIRSDLNSHWQAVSNCFRQIRNRRFAKYYDHWVKKVWSNDPKVVLQQFVALNVACVGWKIVPTKVT